MQFENGNKMKKSLQKPEVLWWLACGVLAMFILLLLARRLMGSN